MTSSGRRWLAWSGAAVMSSALGCGRLAGSEPGAEVVRNTLESLATGELDRSRILYDRGAEPLPIIGKFHKVKFPVSSIQVSPLDPQTNRVAYSCVVPHPGAAFWQWVPIDLPDLKGVPAGIPMRGHFTLVKGDASSGTPWRIRVEDQKNPIALYDRVASQCNMAAFVFERQHGRASGEVIGSQLALFLATYLVALEIEATSQEAKRLFEQMTRVVPARP